jgi:hypothetical protein
MKIKENYIIYPNDTEDSHIIGGYSSEYLNINASVLKLNINMDYREIYTKKMQINTKPEASLNYNGGSFVW